MCNLLEQSELDGSFVPPSSVPPPPGAVVVDFDALLLAEGEWSATCKRLGFTKNVDKFSQAIGLVINLIRDPDEPLTKDPNMRSFTVRPFDEVGKKLTAAKINFEFAEYLKGETHYIVVTIKKSALLSRGALRKDLPSSELLTRANLDEAALMGLSREIANIVGLPPSTQFTSFHGAKLFDFSTRARCATPFRVLGLTSGGATQGDVTAVDLEAHPHLCAEESKYFDRALRSSEAAVAKCDAEMVELEEAINQTTANLAGMRNALESAADTMVDRVAALAAQRAPPSGPLRRQSTGVLDEEWEDEDALPVDASAQGPTPEEQAAQRRQEYGVAADVSDGSENRDLEEARLEAYKRSMKVRAAQPLACRLPCLC